MNQRIAAIIGFFVIFIAGCGIFIYSHSSPAKSIRGESFQQNVVQANAPFSVQGGHVFYRDCEGVPESCTYSLLSSADPLSFSPLTFPDGSMSSYARDNHSAYALDRIIQGADVQTFTLVGDSSENYAKDKEHVYDETSVISDDPQSFVIVFGNSGKATGYSKDAAHVYHDGQIVSGSDPQTFIPLLAPYGYLYSKDAKHVYYNARPIQDADPKSFITVQRTMTADGIHFDAKDAYHFYYAGLSI